MNSAGRVALLRASPITYFWDSFHPNLEHNRGPQSPAASPHWIIGTISVAWHSRTSSKSSHLSAAPWTTSFSSYIKSPVICTAKPQALASALSRVRMTTRTSFFLLLNWSSMFPKSRILRDNSCVLEHHATVP